MAGRAHLGAALAALLALSACGGGPDPAAAPAVELLDALGLHGTRFARAERRDGAVALRDVSGTLDGWGPVHADEIVVRGTARGAGTASAPSVRAVRVTGALSADALSLSAPAAAAPGAGTARSRAIEAEGFAGTLLGLPAKAARIAIAPSGAIAATAAASSLALPALAGGLLPAATWDGQATLTLGANGNAGLQLASARSEAGSVSGTLLLSGPPDQIAALTRLDAAGLADPARWPADVILVDLDANVALRERPAGLPAALAGGARGRAWFARIRVTPRTPVRLREVPGLLAAGDVAGLGLSVGAPGAPQGTAPRP